MNLYIYVPWTDLLTVLCLEKTCQRVLSILLLCEVKRSTSKSLLYFMPGGWYTSVKQKLYLKSWWVQDDCSITFTAWPHYKTFWQTASTVPYTTYSFPHIFKTTAIHMPQLGPRGINWWNSTNKKTNDRGTNEAPIKSQEEWHLLSIKFYLKQRYQRITNNLFRTAAVVPPQSGAHLKLVHII
jgi:hypothetical protein